MRAEGLEPPSSFEHRHLKPACLPISPRPRERSPGASRVANAATWRIDSMIVGVAVGEVTPGYELWHPNREKGEVVTTKFVIVLLMLATAAIAALVTIPGFSLLSGGSSMGIVCLIYAGLYAFFAFLVARWSRGILPVAASLSMMLAIFCAVGANSWVARG